MDDIFENTSFDDPNTNAEQGRETFEPQPPLSETSQDFEPAKPSVESPSFGVDSENVISNSTYQTPQIPEVAPIAPSSVPPVVNPTNAQVSNEHPEPFYETPQTTKLFQRVSVSQNAPYQTPENAQRQSFSCEWNGSGAVTQELGDGFVSTVRQAKEKKKKDR